jgi:type I site-specific restriction endonuclease
MQDYFRKYLRQELETKPEGQIQTAMLAHMATGSGKTYTIGNFVNYLFDLRKTFMKVNKSKDVPRIHALVLNDRINLINQLKTDFLEGRSDKPSLVNKVFQENITSRTFHSKSDDIEHKEDQLLSETGEIDIEVSGK